MARYNRQGQEVRGTRGAGSVYRVGDRWAAAQDVPPLPGQTAQRPRLVRTGRTAAEARTNLAKALADREKQAHAAAHISLADFLAEWLRDVIAPTRRPRTTAIYADYLRRYVLPTLGPRPLASLTARDLQRVYATLQRAGLHASAHQTHAVLHAALAYAVRAELLERSPADRVERPKLPPPQRRRLTRAEARTLLAALPGHPDEAFYLVALYTGARASELGGLRWPSVDWAAQTISLHEQWQRQGHRRIQGPTKSLARVVPVPPQVLAALRRHQERQACTRQAAGPLWQEHALVFPDACGGVQEGRALLVRWQRFAASLGIQGVTLHTLRRTFTSLAREAGVQLELVQEALGHTSPTMMLEVYRQVAPEERVQVARLLAAYLEADGG